MRRRKIKVALYGKHSNRTPLAYPAYRAIFSKHIEYVDGPLDANYLVAGFALDLQRGSDFIRKTCHSRPDLRVIVISEEPLWDTVWSDRAFSKCATMELGDFELNLVVLNHWTSAIYDFYRYPYFITTGNDFFIRYANLFRRNAGFSAKEIARNWDKAPIREAYFAERRTGDAYGVSIPERGIFGLSAFRTQVAEMVCGEGIVKVGQGWGDAARRQELVDWHLDKLARLDMRARIVSALENTHCLNYITEKMFDSFAVLGIPLYWAGPGHAICGRLPMTSFINLYRMSVEQAYEKVRSFEVDSEFVDAYRESQHKLWSLFSDGKGYLEERRRVVNEVMSELWAL